MIQESVEPEREILVLIAYVRESPLNADADKSSRARGLKFCLSLHLHPYFVYTSSEASGESAQLRRLTRAFVAEGCRKYQNLMCWL